MFQKMLSIQSKLGILWRLHKESQLTVFRMSEFEHVCILATVDWTRTVWLIEVFLNCIWVTGGSRFVLCLSLTSANSTHCSLCVFWEVCYSNIHLYFRLSTNKWEVRGSTSRCRCLLPNGFARLTQSKHVDVVF